MQVIIHTALLNAQGTFMLPKQN